MMQNDPTRRSALSVALLAAFAGDGAAGDQRQQPTQDFVGQLRATIWNRTMRRLATFSFSRAKSRQSPE